MREDIMLAITLVIVLITILALDLLILGIAGIVWIVGAISRMVNRLIFGRRK